MKRNWDREDLITHFSLSEADIQWLGGRNAVYQAFCKAFSLLIDSMKRHYHNLSKDDKTIYLDNFDKWLGGSDEY